MRLCVLTLCCGALLHAVEAGPRCAGEILGEVWLPNLPRSAERWKTGPYPALVARPWALALLTKLQPMWSHLRIDGQHVLQALSDSDHGRLTLTRSNDADSPPLMLIDVGLRDHPTSNAFVRLVHDHFPVATRLGADGPSAWLSGGAEAVLFDQRFVLRSNPQPGPVCIPELFSMPASTVDCALALLPEVIPPLLALTELPLEDFQQTDYGEQRIHFTLEPFGLREHSEQDLLASDVERLKDLQLPVVNRACFDQLPADTLFALVTGSNAATTTALMSALLADEEQTISDIDAALDRIGLPDLRTLAGALQGDVVAWAEPGSPFPIATITAAIEEVTARKILAALHTHLGLTLAEDGSVSGMASLVTLHARWHSGSLALTTDPLGLEAALGRRGGFTNHPEIRAALAEIAADAQFAAVSRSAPSWEAMGRLSLLGLTKLKLPAITSMPRDLAAAARFGFLSYSIRAGTVVLDAGGLFGGPLSWIGVIGTGTFSFWCSIIDSVPNEDAVDVEAAADDAELK